MPLLPRSRGLKFLPWIILALFLGACATTSTGPIEPVKSPNDDYSYRLLQLDNGMEVLLISAPNTLKAAAALAVGVGSGDNPPDRGGIAHFLEHMLFLGTDKYPDAAEYEEFITEHGGNRNAYTAFEQTNYFFDINAEHLEGALDRFAQFFIAPRFDVAYVDREKNAVQAEYQMGLKSDPRRGLDVLQEVMNQSHPYSNFAVGSLETLADRPDATIREDLLAFYAKYYSADAMRLVVLGAESLDELQAMVEPMFSPVPSHQREVEDIAEPFFAEGSLPMLVQVKPQATLRQLSISFPIDDYRDAYRVNPLSYLGNLIGHEGEGSLLSQLKAEGLAESLAAGSGLAWPGGALFSVEVTLTEKGVVEYERVLQLLFAYTDMLREEGPRRRLYDEQGQLAALGFRFREHGSPMGYVTGLAAGMEHYDPEDVLRGPYLMEDYDADMLAGLIDQIRPKRAMVTLTDASAEIDRVSVHYEVPYSTRALDAQTLSLAADDPAIAALHLPAPNKYVAEDVSLVDLPDAMPAIPEVALERDRIRIWFMPDDEFRVPKGVTYINFRSTEVGGTAEQAVLASLYTALLMDRVNEYAYPARLAGLNFSVYKHAQGISLRVRGYNDKQLMMVEQLLSDIQDASFDPQRFENIRADMIRSLENVVAKRPSGQVMDDLKESVLYGTWGEQARIEALQNVDQARLEAFAADFWRGTTAEALLYGNFPADTVDELAALLEAVVPQGPAPELPEPRVLKLLAGERAQYDVEVQHDDSVVAWYLQGAGKSWKDRAATGLTAQVMTSGFFQQLRTEQQLGYVVSAFAWSQNQVPGLVMLVQSPVADAPSVAAAMETFVQGVPGSLDEEQFERHKAALVSDILRPDKNIGQRAEFYWRSIAYRQLDFAGRQKVADAVEALTLEEWLAYFEQVFLDKRHSLAVVAPGKWGDLPDLGQRFDNAADIRAAHGAYRLGD
ncbi:MAG: insulinase family protein [Halioglobus sp.]